MAQVGGSRLSRLKVRAGTAAGAGLVAIALTAVGAPPSAALGIPYAYVANGTSSGAVSVLNTSTNKVVTTVPHVFGNWGGHYPQRGATPTSLTDPTR